MYKKVAIFGVGLIGGSVGLALKKRKLAQEVTGVGRRLESLKKAAALRTIDSYTLDPAQGFAGADLIVLAAPAAAVLELLKTGLPFLNSRHLITDACSTKTEVVKAAEGFLPVHLPFVGSHPIAGSEKSGSQAASADLFEGRVTVLTPTSQTSSSDLNAVKSFWESLGSEVFLLSPSEHDRVLAATSHTPHLLAVLASLLVNRLPVAGKEKFTGTGFRDTTRIAAGEPGVWKDVFLTNSGPLLENLTLLEKMLADWKEALRKGDDGYIRRVLDEAAQFQKSLSPEEGKEEEKGG